MNTDDLTTAATLRHRRGHPSTGARVAGPFDVGLSSTAPPTTRSRSAGRPTRTASSAPGRQGTSRPIRRTRPPGGGLVGHAEQRRLPAPTNPYQAQTNSDVIVSQSFDFGANWSAPTAVTLANDQFMPWGAYDTSGTLRIGRSTAARRRQPPVRLLAADADRPGTLASATHGLDGSVRSDQERPLVRRDVEPRVPVRDAFPRRLQQHRRRAGTAHVVAYWTDMRNEAAFASRTGHGEDAYFAYAN